MATSFVVALTLGASLANALTSVLQRQAIETAPAEATLRLRLLTYALRRRAWLAGIVLMNVSFVLHAVALHLGRLSEVQPILTIELVFLVAVLAAWYGFEIRRREWLGVLAVSGGLAGFLYFADPVDGTFSPALPAWIATAAACAAVAALAIVLALRGPRWWRAAMFGTAASVAFAFTAACTKMVAGFAASDWVSLYRHWETYALACCGTLAVFLAQNAIHAGPVVASQSAIVLIDPLASIVIGVGLFGDNLRTTGAWGPLEALSLALMFAGAVWLSRSPLVSGLNGHDLGERGLLRHHARSLAWHGLADRRKA